MSLRVSVIIPAYKEGLAILPVMDRILDAVESDCEILVVVDFEDDPTVPVIWEHAKDHPQLRAVVNTYGRGPANAIRFGIDAAESPVVVVTMADGSDDPRQIDALARLVDRGVAVAAASRYCAGGQQVGGPVLKGTLSRLAGLSLHTLARVGTRDATNQLQGLLHELRPRRRYPQPDRFRDRARTDGQGPSAPATRGRGPHHLVGPHRGSVEFRSDRSHPELRAVVQVRLRPEADDRGSEAGRRRGREDDSESRRDASCVTKSS